MSLQKISRKKIKFYALFILFSLCFIHVNYLIKIDSTTIYHKSLLNQHEQNYNRNKNETNFLNLKEGRNLEDSISSDGGIINITKEVGYFEGYNLFVLEKRNGLDKSIISHSLIISSTEGEILANKTLSIEGSIDSFPAGWINSSTILYGDGEVKGPVLWNFKNNKEQELGFIGHHEYEYNPINNTIFTFYRYYKTYENQAYKFDYIREYNLLGEKIWEMSTDDFISYNQWCPYHDTSADAADLTHSNSLYFDAENDVLYYNARNINTFFKINHSSKEVIWALGEYGDFRLFNKKGEERPILFYHPHAVKMVDNNTFILFDNDFHNQTKLDNYHSRILEITINEKSMTANISWVWESPITYYSKYWGNAERLPNGNRLGVFGLFSHPNSTIGARVVEVNQEGDIVWEMNFPSTEKFVYGIYRVQRFRFKPIVFSPEEIITSTRDNLKIEFSTFYNFDTRIQICGTYSIFLNNTEIQSGDYYYNKFWMVKNYTLTINKIDFGYYNLTVVFYDETSNFIITPINLTITPFYIRNEGPLEIEKGQLDSLLKWWGTTSTPLIYNISINTTFVQSGLWSGGYLYYDLNNLEIGVYLIKLLLINNSITIYNESRLVFIYPLEPPVFTFSPTNVIIGWNTSIHLFWEFSDSTPLKWELFINDSKIESQEWISKVTSVNYTFSTINEGNYLFKLIAYDKAGYTSIATNQVKILPPSPPVIVSYPEVSMIFWGRDTLLTWKIHGAVKWEIWINGTLIESSNVIENFNIKFKINNWDKGKWKLGLYNITLQAYDTFDKKTTSEIWINITYKLGDAYANEVITELSSYYTDGKQALGAADNKFAKIYYDYTNGQLTLDMGEDEEILNKDSNDFIVYSNNGSYSVWLSNDLTKGFNLLGYGEGNQSFDLSDIGFSKARYVKIEYRSGIFVTLDSIEAIYFNIPVDKEPPIIQGPDDFWIWENQTEVEFEWETYDKSPNNFTISINGTIFESGSWNGSNIKFNYHITSVGVLEINLILYDVFQNSSNDTVILMILPIIRSIKLTVMEIIGISVGSFLFISSALYLSILRIRRKK
ncbi:MAG: aryl-sulfate sulfotransferase, partial [Candidatus Heimdallarchaeaceae archaeon]